MWPNNCLHGTSTLTLYIETWKQCPRNYTPFNSPMGKSHNFTLCLKFSAFIITHIVFQNVCLKGLYGSKRWCEVSLYSKLSPLTKFNFIYWHSYDFSRIHKLFTDVFRQCFILFPSYWRSEAYTTHLGPSDKNLFLPKVPSVKSTPHSPPVFHQEDTNEKCQFINFSGSIYWDLCVRLSVLFSVDPHKCSLVWYTSKHGASPNLTLIVSSTLEFHFSFFAFGRTHTRHLILLQCISQCLLCLRSRLFGWCLSSLACSQNARWRSVFIRVGWLFVVTHRDPPCGWPYVHYV